MSKLVINLIFLHLNWIVCIMDAAHGTGWLGLVVVSVWIAIHLRMIDGNRFAEIALIGGSGMLGFVVDTCLAISCYVSRSLEVWVLIANLGYRSDLNVI